MTEQDVKDLAKMVEAHGKQCVALHMLEEGLKRIMFMSPEERSNADITAEETLEKVERLLNG